MLQKDDAVRLFDYTVWANHRVLRSAATLSVDDFKRDLRSSHGGVRGTLTHAMGAEWIWLERFKGVSHTRGIDEGEFPDVVALRDRWTLIEGHRRDWLASLRESDLSAIVSYRTLAGAEFADPLWRLVQHVVNHTTYHRGQVITLLRQLGTWVVSTDLVLWDRERAAEAAAAESGAPRT
jgi:uncharacterized damage-inducible protein DinB